MSDSLPSSAPSASAPQAPKAGPSNLRLRVIYGVIGAALLLGSVWFSPWTFGLFFAFVQAVMLWEFYRMIEAGGSKPAVWIGVGAGLFLFAGTFLFSELSSDAVSGKRSSSFDLTDDYVWQVFTTLISRVFWIVWATSLIVLLVIREIFLWPRYKSPFGNVGATLTGLFYITVPMTLLVVISVGKDGYDPRRIFALLFLIWTSDIGAYAAGKTFGKHKMAPKISPGKTWEGWAGGFLLTLLMGWALGYLLPDMPLTHRLVAASAVAIFAPIGDLAESMLKRSVNVKDSGTIMPGHGGLLDRFDAFLLVLPVLALLQLLAG